MKDTGERLIAKGNEQTLTYGEHLSRYVSVTDIVKGKRVLDVASGSGYGTRILAQTAKTVDGLDYSAEAVAYARKNYGTDNITFTKGNALQMPYDDNQFDVVVSFETIEHLPDPKAFIEEVKRVMKPEGVFIVSTPNDDEFMEGNEFHVHEFQLKELQTLISKAFSQYSYYYQGTYFAASMFKQDHFENSFDSTNTVAAVKTFGQKQSKAIFYIAVASNAKAKLPEIQENIVLADNWSTKTDIEREQVRQNAVNAIKDNKEALAQQVTKLEAELHSIKSSRGWKTVERLRKARNSVSKIK